MVVVTKPALLVVEFPEPEPMTLPFPSTSIPPLGPPDDDDLWAYGNEVFWLVSRYILSGAIPVHCPIGFN
jgi:hypothetical protein